MQEFADNKDLVHSKEHKEVEDMAVDMEEEEEDKVLDMEEGRV